MPQLSNDDGNMMRMRCAVSAIIHRRRIQRDKVYIIAFTAALLKTMKMKFGRTSSNINLPIMTFGLMMTAVPPTIFKRLYRLSYPTFTSLVVLINNNSDLYLQSKELMKLSVTLRYLAGGSYLDISVAHHLPISSIYKLIDETIIRIDCALKIKFEYDNESKLQHISEKLTRGGIRPLTSCCVAIDVIAININETSAQDVLNSLTYYNRKGWFALNLQAMCDSFYRFTFLSCVAPGSTHDSTAFSMSSLSRLLSRQTNKLLSGYWIAADDAYICRNRLLTPWPGRNLSVEKDAFNYWQSSSRIFIEQAFGMLVGLWGVLWRQLRCSLKEIVKS